MNQAAALAIVAAAALELGAPSVSAMEEFNSIVTVDEICALMACRAPSSLRLAGATPGHDLTIEVPRAPFVFQGVLNVVSGERIAYRVDVRDGTIHDIRRLFPEPPGQHFSVGLAPSDRGGRGRSRFMIHNVLERPVTFRLDIVKAGNKEPEPGYSCRVAAGGEFVMPLAFAAYQAFVSDLEIAEDGAAGGAACKAAAAPT